MHHSYFDHGGKPKTPNWSPMKRGKLCRFLNLQSKSVFKQYIKFCDNKDIYNDVKWLVVLSQAYLVCNFLPILAVCIGAIFQALPIRLLLLTFLVNWFAFTLQWQMRGIIVTIKYHTTSFPLFQNQNTSIILNSSYPSRLHTVLICWHRDSNYLLYHLWSAFQCWQDIIILKGNSKCGLTMEKRVSLIERLLRIRNFISYTVGSNSASDSVIQLWMSC